MNDWNFNLEDIVNGLYHEYDPNQVCDRWNDVSENLAKNLSLWTVSIPDPKVSGRCFTYK